MLKPSKYVRKTKTLLRQAKRQLKKVSKSAYARDKRVWAAGIAVIVLVVFWVLPAFAAKAPGQLGYNIKRGEEWLVANLAPLPGWRENVRLDFASDRVDEAAYAASQANKDGDKNSAKTAATISTLLSSYENAYEAQLTTFDRNLNQGQKPSRASAKDYQDDTVNTYTALQLLRVQAPASSQLAVLTAIDDTQQYLATVNDALGQVPLSASDFSQLAKLVPVGVVSQAQVDQLASARSSRALHSNLQKLIEAGQLPSDLSYILDFDQVKQIAPTKLAAFETVSQFDQMERISAVISASRPTAGQKQAIQTFLTNYKAGQTIPASDVQPYVSSIVYGMVLSGQLQTNLPTLNAVHMSSDNQALFDGWKGVLDPPNLAETYQKIITDAAGNPSLHLRLLTRTQQELLAAQKAQVAYLVMPPGWDTTELGQLNTQMGVEIAEAAYTAAKPDAAKELAQITTVQQQLQTSLSQLQTAHNTEVTNLKEEINNFKGTPDQLATLNQQLVSLNQTYETTVNGLQDQINTISSSHTKLGDAITNLRQEQLTNITALELRAATHAEGLTDAAKTQLTTTLNQINAASQTLIHNLTSQVNDLGSSHASLRDQLTGEITTIKDNYQALKTDVQAQLDAGVATSGQLQTTLNQVRGDLATQTSDLHNLSSSGAALSQLVNQVKTDSQAGLADLQNKVGVLQLSHQTLQTAVSELSTVSQTSQALIDTLQSQVDALGASHTQLRQELTADLQTVQRDYTSLIAGVQAQVDTGVATSTQLTGTLQTVQHDLATQTAQIAGLGNTTANLSNLISQVETTANTQASNLQGQIDGLHISQQALETSLDALNSQQAASITDLTSQLSGLRVIQAEAQADIADLVQVQASSQATIGNLNTNFEGLQSSLEGAITANASLQADVSNQQSELASLTTQVQSGIDTLTAQQAALSTQLTSLANNVTTLTQTVNTAQSTANGAQTDLNTLLANAPWAIPEGMYVTQSDLDTVTAHLDTQFAQKSAELDAQFQAYQQTLNTTVSQLTTQANNTSTAVTNLTTTVTNNQTSQQTQINTLNAQIQTLQTQVQQLLHPPTGL